MRDQALWTWHVTAGVVILVFLGLHMIIMHLGSTVGVFNPAGGHPVDWGNVAARGKSIFFLVTYVILLGTALFHGLYGLRNIVFELGLSRGLKTAVSVVLLLGGLGLFALGTWVLVVSYQVPQTA